MKKRSKETPRMLPYVIQAVTDLKDISGTTTRKILDQVHTAINILNVKPKPRNVVMQVKRALKHAVESGVLKHRAGKYRLRFESSPNIKDKSCKIRSRRIRMTRRHRRHKSSRRRPRTRHRRRRRAEFSYSPSGTSATMSATSDRSTSYRSTTFDSYESDNKSRSRRRHRRSLAKKTVQMKRSATKRKAKPRARQRRQGTPMPKDITGEEVEDSGTAKPEGENVETLFTDSNVNNDQGDHEGVTNAELSGAMEIVPPECDNPDCLCNLKQEPNEDNNYDNCEDIDRPYSM